MGPPVGERGDAADEPEQGTSKVDPDGVLHALHVAVALGVLVDVHAAEQPKQRNPQGEQHEAPGRHQRESQDERNQVEQRGHSRQDADDHRVDLLDPPSLVQLEARWWHGPGEKIAAYPFSVRVLPLLVGPVQVRTVEPTDGHGEHELEEMQHREGEVAESHAKKPHLGGRPRA